MFEIHKANEEPSKADISALQSLSTDKTVLTTWTSLRKPSANKGRIGRSIKRAVKVACSDGRPSRLKNPPGILPTEYNFSSYDTVSGKKSVSLATFDAVAVDKTTVSS